MKKSDCNHCIYKTCEIAHENGGAEGCGDCTKCKEEKRDTVNNCPMYYNPTEKSLTEKYLLNDPFWDRPMYHMDDDE